MKFRVGQKVRLDRLVSQRGHGVGYLASGYVPVEKVVAGVSGDRVWFKGSQNAYRFSSDLTWGTVLQRIGGYGVARYWVVD